MEIKPNGEIPPFPHVGEEIIKVEKGKGVCIVFPHIDKGYHEHL